MRRIILDDKTKGEVLTDILGRSQKNYETEEKLVKDILADVEKRGDEALFAYTERFDHLKLTPENMFVTDEEMGEAEEFLKREMPGIPEVINEAAANVTRFHEAQKRQSFFVEEPGGIYLGQRILPLERVGVYVPGGKAAYPSSVLMNILPAKVAGVKEIFMATPADREGKVNPAVLYAAKIAGVSKILKAGGAQAVAAMAYGTESVPRVDKITGPGNIYVALAKKLVYGRVSIDSVAGPSEICVLADETADPRFVAADLLSQAEHDEMASAVLVTVSPKLAEQVEKEIEAFLPKLPRKEIIEKSLERYGFILLADDMEAAIDAANAIASEHLEIITADPVETMSGIRNAGAIFLGHWSSEPLGDYFAGPDHILPTNGTARFFSPLSVDDFIKKTSLIRYSRQALERVHEKIEAFAALEGLNAHENSIRVRFLDT